MIPQVLDGRSFGRVLGQTPGDDILSALAHILPTLGVETEAPPDNVIGYILNVAVIAPGERDTARQASVEATAHAPDVYLLRVGTLAARRQDLGSDILRSAAQCLHNGILLHELAEPKVGHLEQRVLVLGGQQDVVGLDVSMRDPFVVQVLEGFTYLDKEELGRRFAEPPLRHFADPGDHVAATHQLEDHKDGLWSVVNVKHTHDAGLVRG